MKKLSLHNISMSKKLFFVFLIIVVIPVLIMGIYFPMQQNQEATQGMMSSYQYSAERLSSEVMETLRDYLEIPLSKSYDKALVAFVNARYHDDLNQYESIVDTVFPLYEQLQYKNVNLRMKIMHKNPTLNMSGMLEYDLEMPPISGLVFTSEMIGKTDYLTACIPIIDTKETKRTVGILKIYIPFWLIRDILDSYGAVEHPVFLYDEQGNLMTGTAEETIRENRDYREIIYQIDYPRLNIEGWNLVYMAPARQLKEKLREICLQALNLAIVCICVSMMVIAVFTNSFKRRINLLVEGMKRLRQGDTKVQIEEVSLDEIGQLCGDFNVMVNKLDQLIQDNYQSQIELQDVEIERQKLKNEQVQSAFLALQRQINPHYLFNTLESIRMKVLMNGDRETAAIIEEFSSGYREMMHTSYEMISIEEELKLVKNFFSVIRFRFGEHIQLHILLENEDIKNYKIFKFIIQPLVENAIYHGVERQDEDGIIHLSICTKAEYLLIKVTDNGIGMSHQKIEEIMESIRHPKEGDNKNLALRNIYSRLALVYKNNFNFEIESTEGQYTSVQLTIPASMHGEGDLWTENCRF